MTRNSKSRKKPDKTVNQNLKNARTHPKASDDLPEVQRDAGKVAVAKGLFWANEVERFIPQGLGSQAALEMIGKCRKQKIVSIEAASSVECGKVPNAVITMGDNSTFCAKFNPRSNNTVLGELMAFHLSRLLGLDNVPPVLLSYVNVTSPSPWADVKDILPSLLWSSDTYVALIGWIPGLRWSGGKVAIPPLTAWCLQTGSVLTSEEVNEHVLGACNNSYSINDDSSSSRSSSSNNNNNNNNTTTINNNNNNNTSNSNSNSNNNDKNNNNNDDNNNNKNNSNMFKNNSNSNNDNNNNNKSNNNNNSNLFKNNSNNSNKNSSNNRCLIEAKRQLSSVAQWGTVVIFDYITANYDRAANMALNTPAHPDQTVRNLQQNRGGKLWLLDNEAAFFTSYTFLRQGSSSGGNTIQRAHLRHLHSTCVFQESLVRHLTRLVGGKYSPGKSQRPAKIFLEYVRTREELFDHVVDVDSDSFRLFGDVFSRRVLDVLDWVERCRVLLDKNK